MNLPEAIKYLQQYRRDGEPHDLTYFEHAIDLGIEALNRELHNRRGSKYVIVAKLEGETVEEQQPK